MPLTKSSSEAAFKQNVAEMRLAGHPRAQALAAAYRNQSEAKAQGHAKGGIIPGVSRVGGTGPTHFHGLVHGSGNGRSDSISTRVPKGSYVVPADIVSGIGHGDTIAGARALEHSFPEEEGRLHTRAHVRGFSPLMQSPFKRAFSAKSQLADGGVPEMSDVLLSAGEFLIGPKALLKKYGSLKHAHDVMDAYIVHRRKKLIKETKALKPPVGSKQAKSARRK